MVNLSNKKCPYIIYDVYKMSKGRLSELINLWYKIPQHGLVTIKRVDNATSNFLYGRAFNPVTIKYFESYAKEGYHPYKAQIYSIDDSSYGTWFYKLDVKLLMEWISLQKRLNGHEFLDYCVSIGGDKETIDYN